MPVPVLTIAQMRAWEKATWASGQTEDEVIRQVGRVVAQRAMQLTRDGEVILVLAGRGHNGDDARATVGHWRQRTVRVLNVQSPVQGLEEFRASLSPRPALVVDALFGIGLNRELDADWCRFLGEINASGLRVLAVDVPSGLNADDGNPLGAAVEAGLTLTVGAPKAGLLRPHAARYVGRLDVAASVGLAPCAEVADEQWTLPEDFAGFPPRRSVAGHKGSFGHLGILAGSLGYHGAAVLAARGALRSRPGLVTVVAPEAAYVPVASQCQAVMVHPWSSVFSFRDNVSAFLIGPGLVAANFPAEMRTLARRLWAEASQPVVADAGAFEFLPAGETRVPALRVITPHPGEAARLLRRSTRQVQADRVAAVRDLSRLHGNSWVVLKGHQSVVGRMDGPVFVNGSGNPGLAQGGSGDLLAGYLAGLLAQPELQAEPLTTIRFAVWQHGASADRLEAGAPNWTIEDLAAVLGAVPAGG